MDAITSSLGGNKAVAMSWLYFLQFIYFSLPQLTPVLFGWHGLFRGADL